MAGRAAAAVAMRPSPGGSARPDRDGDDALRKRGRASRGTIATPEPGRDQRDLGFELAHEEVGLDPGQLPASATRGRSPRAAPRSTARAGSGCASPTGHRRAGGPAGTQQVGDVEPELDRARRRAAAAAPPRASRRARPGRRARGPARPAPRAGRTRPGRWSAAGGRSASRRSAYGSSARQAVANDAMTSRPDDGVAVRGERRLGLVDRGQHPGRRARPAPGRRR